MVSKMKRKKRGFTIVEMLMVIAVLAVLVGIVSTAASSVIRKSRARKNEALRAALQAGIATYCQQTGFWPPGKNGTLQKWADDGLDPEFRNKGIHVAHLDDNQYDELMEGLMLICLNNAGAPVMDASGFTSVRKANTSSKGTDGLPKCYGEDVRAWVAKARASNARGSVPTISQLAFGYSSSENRYFRRFRVYYNSESDSVTVGYAKKNNGAEDK